MMLASDDRNNRHLYRIAIQIGVAYEAGEK